MAERASRPSLQIAQPLARLTLRFAVVTALGAAAWPLVQNGFTRAFCAVGDAALAGHRFGSGGYVELEAGDAVWPETAARDATWTARVRLRVDGIAEEHSVTVNPRRLSYLPMLFFVAAIAAVPVGWSARARCLAVGLPLLGLLTLGSLWAVCAWLFARVPGLVYEPSAVRQVALEMLYEGVVTPMATKVIVPLLMALVLVRWPHGSAGARTG